MWLALILAWHLVEHAAAAAGSQNPEDPEPQAPPATAAALCVCPEGWECKREGLCVPPAWNSTEACLGAASAAGGAEACSQLVAETLDAGRGWLLAVVSGEDRESLVSAETLTGEYLRAWRKAADAALARLKAAPARSLLSLGTRRDLQAILSHAWEQRPVQQFDISQSQCSDAMDASHRRCFYNMVKVMSGSWVQRAWFPDKVISTQSRYLGTMARAADYVRKKTGRAMYVDCYLLELFPNLNSLFFRPVKQFAESQYRPAAKAIRLHVVTPLKGSRDAFAKECGLKPYQILLEPQMPVSSAFLDGSLPRPGEAVDVALEAATPAEELFLGGKEKVISIRAEDTVTLVAFTGQPNPATFHSYVEQLTKVGPLKPKNSKAVGKGLNWVFADTGSPDWREHEEVYNATSAMAAIFNLHQEEAGGRTRLIPFSHQLTQLRRLKGRSEMIITYGGNFVAGELLALAARGDERHILIEVGGTDGLDVAGQKRIAADNWWEREAWEQTAFIYMNAQEKRNYMYLAKKVDASLTTTQTFLDAWEDGGMKVGGYCTEIGACNSQLWDGTSACKHTTPRCEKAVNKVMTAARSWTLLLTSSGGGGHMAAADVLTRKHSKAYHDSLASAMAELEMTRSMLTTPAYNGLRAMVDFAQKAEPVIKIDLMSSPCTNLLGEHGLGLGKAFSNVWNLGQSLGSVRALTGMSKAQSLEDDVFHRQCQKYMRNVIGGNRLTRVSPPSSVVSCQPMQHSAVAAALDEVAKEAVAELTLDIYLTELPTTHAVAFLDPLKVMTEHYPQAANHVRLHTLPPLSGKAEALAERTGLNTSQIVFEEHMPIDERLWGMELPRPGTAANITLEAGCPREEAFLGRQSKVFSIAAQDSVTLVMLGSQPTVSTMREYVQRFVQSTPQRAAENPAALHWVFFAAGNPKQSAFANLYASLADLADRFNFLQRMTGGRVRLVPFTRQSITELLSRSDVTLTRSGGITSGELLAMNERGDKRQVLMHLEVPKDQSAIEPEADSNLRANWEHLALTDGMVEWEMGNAVYLRQVLNATLVTPKKLPHVW